MRTMNKVFYAVATILQVILLLGVYVVNYFTRKRMGMLRYVIYKNGVFENTYPIQQLQYICIILLIILTILVLIFYVKSKSNLNKKLINSNIFMLFLISIYVGFNLLYSTEDFRAFYFMSLMLGVAALIQIIKVFFSTLIYKSKN